MDRILKSKYKILDKIADSPSHVTYKGTMVDSDKNIVIKIYRRQYLNSVLIKQLKKDISRLSKLDSPFIPRLIDGDYGWQGFYFIREFVEGTSLQEIKKPIEPETVTNIALSICEALSAAHSTGTVHGSLTPENIFISSGNSRVKAADFGIKKAVAYPVDQKAKWLFDASSLYAPAEVLLGEEPSFRSDIYQTGLLIFFMLTGQLPLRSKQDLKFVVEKMKDEPLLPSQLNGKAPKYLDEIVFRCLEKDPLMRFESVEELAECLRSKSVAPRNRTFIDMLEIDYSEEPAPKKLEEPVEEPLEIVPEKKPLKESSILEERHFEEKNEEINMFRWVFMAVWLAIAAGIIYSLINIILIGE